MQATLVGIVAVLIGLLIGYLSWGVQAGKVASELTEVKTKLTEGQQAAAREGELATKVQGIEAQIKEATASVSKEHEARQKLEKLAARLKKK